MSTDSKRELLDNALIAELEAIGKYVSDVAVPDTSLAELKERIASIETHLTNAKHVLQSHATALRDVTGAMRDQNIDIAELKRKREHTD